MWSFIVIGFLGIISSSGAQLTRKYQNCMVLGYADGVQLSWNISGTQIYFGLEGNFTNGYLATGISNNIGGAQPLNSDIWAASGQSLYDLFTDNKDHKPDLDVTDNLQNKIVTRSGTKIFAEWSRSLSATGSEDKAITPGTAQNVIWSGNPTVPMRSGKFDSQGHNGANGWKGITSIDFGKSYSCDQSTNSSGGTSFQGNGFKVDWTLDAAKTAITFTMTSDGTGWVGLGISSTPGMANMDCYLGNVVGGVASVQDSFSTASGVAPAADSQNDATNVTGTESGGKTTITFTRKLDTGDAKDFVIKDQTVFLIYAYQATDDTRTTKHTLYGLGRVNFLNSNSNGGSGSGNNSVPVGAPIVPADGATWASDDGNFQLQWKVVDGTIDVLVAAKTTGWFGCGFETDTSMEGSDYAIGWVESGSSYMLDSFAPRYEQPASDTSIGGVNDVTITGSEEVDGWTRISFRRPLKGSDADDVEIIDGNMYFHYAIKNDADGLFFDDATGFSLVKHDIVGVSSPINFFSGAVGKGIADIFSPGGLLLLIVGVCFVVFLAFRMGNKLRKRFSDKDRKNRTYPDIELKVQDIKDEESQPTPPIRDDDDDDDFENDPASQGSKTISLPSNGSSHNPSSPYIPSDKIPMKSHAHRAINFWRALRNIRVPRSHIQLEFILIFSIYIIINFCCFIIGLPLYHKSIGTLIAANAMLLVIPASRNSVISWLTGMAFDRTILYHRWLGRFTVCLTTIHVIMVLTKYYDAPDVLTSRYNTFGWTGWAFSLFILGTSIDPIRRKFYEIFHLVHYAFIGFFVFGCLHNPKFVPFTIAACCLYLFDKILRILWGAAPKKTLKFHYKEGDIVQVQFPKGFLPRLFKMHRVGQYIFVNFPTISPTEWHPFSVSSGPNEKSMEIHVKSLGDFSKYFST
eukprot:TRINITY_DN5635_c0_g1_i1.p1 TRINITY_DN5635_c0_g1~~TRINITY_DN5635_c0_g1_i1.p1  ORF type:complete len:913 (+),score=232.87 TRINITY_DN5635_c0_g1_i1:47-2785(+)